MLLTIKVREKRRFWAIWCNEIAMEFKSQTRTEAAEEPRRDEDLASQLDLYAPQVMRYVAPGLYPAIRGSTPRGRTSDVGYDIYAE